MNMKEQLKGSLLLLTGALIWGVAFVAQSVGMDYIGPFTFQTIRSLLAIVSLLPLIWLLDFRKKDGSSYLNRWKSKRLWKAGFFAGLALFAGSGLQQVGLVYTEPGKAGFITAMYIVMVPVFGLFLNQKTNWRIWVSVVLAVTGLYLLSCLGASGINIGDLYMLCAAACFAVQILIVEYLGQNVDGIRMNCVQFMIVLVFSAIMMFTTETPTIANITACTAPLLYTGILSSAVAYSLQIVGQQHLSSTRASLILSMESVFAVLAGWILLHQSLSPVEILGCALVFCAVLLSQR